MPKREELPLTGASLDSRHDVLRTRDMGQFPDLQSRTNAEAIHSALNFLLAQLSDRYWTDFNLPTGESNTWVTAYVLARIGEIPSSYINSAMQQQLQASVDWLLENRRCDGAWGYDSGSESDAESTSWAVLALRRHGRNVPGEACGFIQGCRRSDGGVAAFPETSPSGKAWRSGAPDVTAVAVNALQVLDQEAEDFMASCWLQTNRPLPAYRFVSRIYICAAILEWDTGMVSWPILEKLCDIMSYNRAENAFEQALLLRCLTRLGIQTAASVAAGLRCMQQADGGWPASAFLRTTPSGRYGGAEHVYLDERRILTTATALSALAVSEDTSETKPGAGRTGFQQEPAS